MTEQMMKEQINELKVRVFDLQEALADERNAMGRFCGIIASMIGLEGEDAQDLQNYINRVAELTGHADGVADEAEQKEG